ncbi:hypothetical protein WR25_20130 [Diploscapter pachys]|uniref:Homeobox domain-containing protein n=1 Tax=Diploscapter pachys TaxID=2018661 RepID=A0A2A2M059_9BILA|nr:hypothetical protein WR25_20130 [Diploscapter pachys]
MGHHKKINADSQSLAELSQVIEEYKAFRVEYRTTYKDVNNYFNSRFFSNYTDHYPLKYFLALRSELGSLEEFLRFKDRLKAFMQEQRRVGVDKSKRRRAFEFEAGQQDELLAYYAINTYPTSEERNKLAARTRLTEKQVKSWFKYYRHRHSSTNKPQTPQLVRRLSSNPNLPCPRRSAASEASRRILKSCIKTANRAAQKKRVRFVVDDGQEAKALKRNYDVPILSIYVSSASVFSDDDEDMPGLQHVQSQSDADGVNSLVDASSLDTTLMEVEMETETETEAEREQDEYMTEAAGQSESPTHDRYTLTTLNEVQPHGRSALELLYVHVPSVEQAWNAAAYEWVSYNPYDYIQ